MTTQYLTPHPVLPQVHSPYVRLASAEVAAELALLDLRETITRAQFAADGAYSLALAAGHTSGVYAAFIYHTEFVDEMARQGSPMPCGCPYCAMGKAGAL
jgi:hypothetical protein